VVTLPGEMFVEYGLMMKNFSPFDNTIIVEMANNGVNYVPNKKAFSQGGYEVENSRLAPGGGEMLAEVAIEMLKELKSDAR
jgi:neutral ceramidase